MPVHRLSLITLSTAALVLALAACAPVSPEPAESPIGDGELVLYSGRNEQLVAPIIEQFTEESGIEVTVRYGSSSEMNALLSEEGANSPAQVFLSQDAGALGSLGSAGLLATLPDDLTSLIPQGFTSEDGTWIGVTGRARVLAYDSSVLSADQVPDTVDALVAPKWNGKVAFAPGNASMQSFVTALRVLEGEEAAEAWVKGMSENAPHITEDNNTSLNLVDSGEAAIGLINHYYWYEKAAEVGEDAMRAQIKFLPGDAGGIVNVSGAAILSGAADDPDALAFLRYLVSAAGQRYFVEHTFEYPLLPGVDAPAGLPSLASLINPQLDLSDLESLEATQALLAKYGLL